MNCPTCGVENPEGGRFCHNCGHDFSSPVTDMPGPPKSGGPEPRRFPLVSVVILLVAVLFGSFLLSPLLLSVHSPEKSIVIEPNSYYSVRIDVYGAGVVKYRAIQTADTQVVLVQLNKLNYDRFVSGKEYRYSGYGLLGTAGSEYSTETGTIWSEYFVFVNDDPTPATILFGYDVTVVLSLIIVGPLLAGALLVLLFVVIFIPHARSHRASADPTQSREK